MARKNRPRSPLPAATSTTNARTSTTSTLGHIPSLTSSSTASIASISSIPSISSFQSTESTATITPSTTGLKQKATATPAASSSSWGLFSSSSSPAKNKSLLKNKENKENKGKGSLASQEVASPKQPNGHHGPSTKDSLGLLPLLPALDDFDLLPLLNESSSSSSSSPSFTATSTTTTNTLNNTYTRPVLSSSSSSTHHRHFFTAQSTSSPPPRPLSSALSSSSLTSSTTPSRMHTTTFDTHGAIDLTRLEASDYFINNTDFDPPKKPSMASKTGPPSIGSKSNMTSASVDEDGHDQHQARSSRQPLGGDPSLAPPAPPRYIIRKPSATALNTSQTTSPAPSLASSMISDQSSLHSQLQLQQQQQQQTTLPRQQLKQQPPSQSTSNPQQQPSIQQPSKQRQQQQQQPPPKQQPKQPVETRSPKDSSRAGPSLTFSPPPANANTSKKAAAKSNAAAAGSEADPSSPNLRTRLSRLFRQSPKAEKAPVLDQRYRNEQQRLYQESLKRNALKKDNAVANGSAVATAPSSSGKATAATLAPMPVASATTAVPPPSIPTSVSTAASPTRTKVASTTATPALPQPQPLPPIQKSTPKLQSPPPVAPVHVPSPGPGPKHGPAHTVVAQTEAPMVVAHVHTPALAVISAQSPAPTLETKQVQDEVSVKAGVASVAVPDTIVSPTTTTVNEPSGQNEDEDALTTRTPATTKAIAESSQHDALDLTSDQEAPPADRTRSTTRKVAAIAIPQTSFAPGLTPNQYSPPSSPVPRPGTNRQRRVSSVSSSHSIRQVGTYGSPGRKSNPYFPAAIARFSNGNKFSQNSFDPSSSGKRRSIGGASDRSRGGADGSREMLPIVPVPPIPAAYLPSVAPVKPRPPSVASTTNSIVSEAKEREPLPALPVNQEEDETDTNETTGLPKEMPAVDSAPTMTPSPALAPAPTMFMAYEEEYDIEKDDSARSSAQASPFQPKTMFPLADNSPKGRNLFNARPITPSQSQPQMGPSMSSPIAHQQQQSEESRATDQSYDQGTVRSNTLPSPVTTWSTATGVPTEVGTIPNSLKSSGRTESAYFRPMPSFESQPSETTPSIVTMSSAQLAQVHREQGIITTEEPWDDAESQQSHGQPMVQVQRPSTEISTNRPLSGVSSILSSSTGQPLPTQQPSSKQYASASQWSESSYDPCAPIRWDELFEMDPNSKGPLWLSNRGLGQIPHKFFDGLRNLRELYLDHNDIKVVPDSLLKLSKLDVLDLSCNSISSFHSAFKLKKLKNLHRLNLDHNMLTDISPIYKLKSLRELRLNHNFVPYLAIAIQNMTKLKILAMESNSLATLPESMGKLGNLCELRLSDNNLRALPESIGSIRTLQVLALRSNLLEKLPESWKDMENLATLDLACNRLTALPSDMVRLPKLTHLDLHDNQLQFLPEKIGQLGNLVVLQLCNNQLRELPKDIGKLRDLHDLVLSFNYLQTLPDEIGKLNKLQELKFDNNPLRCLPKTIHQLSNVRRVHLQGCALRDLPVELGTAFKELVYLDLSSNQFEVMPALDNMNKLEEFYISNNYLREIGTSSLNLQSSSTHSNNYNTGTLSGPMGGGVGLANSAQVGSGTMGSAGGALVSMSGGPGSNGFAMMGGVTASKLSELRRLRIFEAHNNQIRVLSGKIKLLHRLEVLDLGENLLSWLPKEVGDLALLKVLILRGNPIKSLPSSLTKLMGTLEVFRIGAWPENGFEITREQSQMNMKISVLQSFMPQQIERTLLWRMHDTILQRMQELDSQQYRDLHSLDGMNSSLGPISRALTTSPPRFSGSTFTLGSNPSNVLQIVRPMSTPLFNDGEPKTRMGISQGLAIATQHMMINRSFALPPVNNPMDGSSISTTVSASASVRDSNSMDYTRVPTVALNSEGIHPNDVEYSTNRNAPTLQFSTHVHPKTQSAPITNLPMSMSPVAVTAPSGPLSAFPLLNSLRPRKNPQLQAVKNGAAVRPKSMYTQSTTTSQDLAPAQQEQPTFNNRISRVFEFASGNNRTKSAEIQVPAKATALENSTLQLSSDAMIALGLGTQPGSAGSVIAHSNNVDRLGFGLNSGRNGRLGDGSLADIKNSMAIKSSPSLTSMPLPILAAAASARPTSPAPGDSNGSSSAAAKFSKTTFGRPVSPLPGHLYTSPLKRASSTSGPTGRTFSGESNSNNKATTSLPWLRLKTSPAQEMMPTPLGQQEKQHSSSSMDFPGTSASIHSNASSSLMRQPSMTLLSAPTPPPIMLDYELDTSASLDIPLHMYYSAGGDDVDGDPIGETTENEGGDGLGIDGDTEEEDRQSLAGGIGKDSKQQPLQQQQDQNFQQQQQQHHPHHQQHSSSHVQGANQLNSTDPVLKIAVLKGVYDQILGNMDQMAEKNIQESPAKKNHRFKLLNTLRFLKQGGANGGGERERGSDRERERGGGSRASASLGRQSGYQQRQESSHYQHHPHHHHHGSLPSNGHATNSL